MPDLCLDQYYMANTLNGRGTNWQKGKENGEAIPITYWGQYKERERDHCEPDTDSEDNACCEAPEGTTAAEGTDLRTLEIMPGWWRYNPYSAEVMRCRYEFECKGSGIINFTSGTNIENSTINHTGISTSIALLAGDGLCANGYTGPMCRRVKWK